VKTKRGYSRQVPAAYIEDCLDPFYPFDRDLYEDEHVIYHGTWSTHCPQIEQSGMGKACIAYRQADIDALCQICLRFGNTGDPMRGGFSVLDACAYGISPGNRPIYLTGNYWCARGYAKNRGGETIHHALEAIADMERCFAQGKRRQELQTRLRANARTATAEEGELIREQIANLQDRLLLEKSRQHLEEISARLKPLARGGFPVVYAVKGNPRWFREPRPLSRIETVAVPRVAVSRLKARADFLNRVTDVFVDALMPKPLHWNPRPYIEFIYAMRAEHHFRQHLAFLEHARDPIISTLYLDVFGLEAGSCEQERHGKEDRSNRRRDRKSISSK
jgi:hypothetical protein